MRTLRSILTAALTLGLYTGPGWAQTPAAPALRGAVTDPSGASVPGALVQLRRPGTDQRVLTDAQGQYAFPVLRPGKYQLRVIAKGFTVVQRRDFEITPATTFDVQLTIEAEAQVINVEDEANNVDVDPSSNGGALVLKEKELAALSDDPDELEQQLQAMAGPSTGPNGGQIYIDGFTGGKLPPKASIREVRINSNPYAPEYDRPGFGRIEILTRPGTSNIRGQAFVQYNKEALNSRSPLLAQSQRPPYQTRFYGFNLSGPIKKQKASFGFDLERRSINENAFILATTLDSNLNEVNVNQAILTPQVRTTVSPRLDYAFNANNTMVLRYQNTRSAQDNEGVGNFSLPSKAYNQTDSENVLQATETSIIGTKAINETRFQYMRSNLGKLGDNSIPALNVQGAFDSGGAQVGDSYHLAKRFELTNTTTYTHGPHTVKWGARLRQSFTDDLSVSNFGGSYAFFGAVGPALDAINQPTGETIQLSALERYRRTLLFSHAGYSAAQIRALGGGASQFSLAAGMPLANVDQFDAGLFASDDWRVRPNLNLSYGIRYEEQTNLGDRADFAPRVGLAWGIGGGSGNAVKTVLRVGAGVFYDRIAESVTLQALRFNGTAQLSYLIQNPDFFPAIPSLSSLAGSQQPQQLQLVDRTLASPRNYQTSVGIEHQFNQYFRLSAQYIGSRGVHLQRFRNINAPLDGSYPYGDRQLRLLTESTGFSRTNQIVISPNLNYKKIFLFGFFSLGYGKSDAEGIPADPYNLRAEWGPSGFADVRRRFILGTNLPLPLKFSVSPFISASSGQPYNITTGRDTNGDGFTSERPSLLAAAGASDCQGGSLVYEPAFGCFNLNPTAGTAIGRNSARGPGNFSLNLRLSRSWGFGSKGESAPVDGGPPPGAGGLRGPEGGGGRGPGGGGPPMGMGGGGGRGFGGRGGPGGGFGGSTGKKYGITLSVSARNVLNHVNYAPPSGDLSSPFFGEYRSLAGFGPFGGASTYNRKVDIQLRFTF